MILSFGRMVGGRECWRGGWGQGTAALWLCGFAGMVFLLGGMDWVCVDR